MKTFRINKLVTAIAACAAVLALAEPVAAATQTGTSRAAFPAAICDGVSPAPAKDKDSSGKLITPQPIDGKRSVPVILVHGWNGNTDTFTHPIDLFADGGDGGDGVKNPFSITGELQNIRGLAVYDFDYSQYSDRWVTDGHIGPRLAAAVKCLTDYYGTKAEIIAHSMGGLASRYALGQTVSGTRISDRVSAVATFGTPNTGSAVATIASAALNKAEKGAMKAAEAFGDNRISDAVVGAWLVTQVCGREITKSTKDLKPPCSNLPAWAAGFDSDAARAMHVGSPELAALPRWPAGIPITAIQGSIMLRGVSLFGAGDLSGGFNDGDFIVTNSSASAFSTTSKDESCGYSLSAVFQKSDTRVEATPLSGGALKNGKLSIGALTGPDNPCFHGNLLWTINGTNVAVNAIKASAQNTPSNEQPDLQLPSASAPVGAKTTCASYKKLSSSEKFAVIERIAQEHQWKDRSPSYIKLGQYSADLYCATHSADAQVGGIDFG